MDLPELLIWHMLVPLVSELWPLVACFNNVTGAKTYQFDKPNHAENDPVWLTLVQPGPNNKAKLVRNCAHHVDSSLEWHLDKLRLNLSHLFILGTLLQENKRHHPLACPSLLLRVPIYPPKNPVNSHHKLPSKISRDFSTATSDGRWDPLYDPDLVELERN